MDDKKYTYDIGKYTIGVDTNGEDGIGLTIAIIKNGEINFLGNCYGENARCIDLLIKENQELKNIINQIGFEPDEIAFLQQDNAELKKQLESANEQISYLRRSIERKEETIIELGHERVPYENEYVEELKKQLEEKENIACNWKDSCLENAGKIEELETQQNEFIKYLKDETKRINPKILDDGELNLRLDDIKYTQYLTYKEILQKYKEIVGGIENENND